MNVANVHLLSAAARTIRPTWYRAINLAFLPTALSVAHTAVIPSRFNEAPANPANQFEILYLAENPMVALFEVAALFGSPTSPGGVVANPVGTWVSLTLTVHLQNIVDLTDLAEQVKIETTAQELTGDWRGYHNRSPRTTVKLPVAPAETQKLGLALYRQKWEGFVTLSARLSEYEILAVFPQNLQSGSYVEFNDPLTGNKVRIP